MAEKHEVISDSPGIHCEQILLQVILCDWGNHNFFFFGFAKKVTSIMSQILSPRHSSLQRGLKGWGGKKSH